MKPTEWIALAMMPFNIRPRKWWDYLNPLFWRRKRMVEAFMAYQWKEEGMDAKLEKALIEAFKYGEGWYDPAARRGPIDHYKETK